MTLLNNGPRLSKYITKNIRLEPKPLLFLSLPHREALYGGAAGGMKGSLTTSLVNARRMGYDVNSEKSLLEFKMKYGQKVVTPFGEKLIEDIKVGDQVSNPDGSVSKVIKVSGIRERECYKVEFIDGAIAIVSDDHIWSVKKSGVRTRRKVEDPYSTESKSHQEAFNKELLRRYKNMTTEQIADHYKKELKKGDEKRIYWLSAPLPEPIVYSFPVGKTMMLPFYSFGVWLGDGSSGDQTPRWTKPDKNIYKYVKNEIESSTEDVVNKIDEGTYSIVGTYFRDGLRSVKVSKCRSWEKFIPKQYLYGSVEDRWKLAQGLFDTDGTADSRGQVYYSTTSKKLANDVKSLVNSLGLIATISPVDKPAYTHNGKKKIGRPAYAIYVTGRNRSQLFLNCKAKKDRAKDINNEGGRRIISVKKLKGKFETKCILVDHPNHLYMTNDFIVTHNTESLLASALQYSDIPGYSAVLFRRSLQEHKKPNCLIPRAKKWLKDWIKTKEVVWDGSEHKFTFKTTNPDGSEGDPSTLSFGYCYNVDTELQYQGAEYQFIGWDEGTQIREQDFLYLFSRLRKVACPIHKTTMVFNEEFGMDVAVPNYVEGCETCKQRAMVPVRVRTATNPGNRSHNFFKERYQLRRDPKTKLFRGYNPDRPFIPAYVQDNPHLDGESYMRSLKELDPVRAKQLIEGDWDASPDSLYRKEHCRYWTNHAEYIMFDDKAYKRHQCKWFFTSDVASTAAEMLDGDETALGFWCFTPDYHLGLIDAEVFSKTIPDTVESAISFFKKWRKYSPDSFVIEKNGVGIALAQTLEQRGLPIVELHKSVDKVQFAQQGILRMNQGRIFLPKDYRQWKRRVEDQLFVWQGLDDEQDDIVDMVSTAAFHVDWGGFDVNSLENVGLLDPGTASHTATNIQISDHPDWDHFQSNGLIF